MLSMERVNKDLDTLNVVRGGVSASQALDRIA